MRPEWKEGRELGSEFWIMPVKVPNESSKQNDVYIICKEERISIDEDSLSEYVFAFLQKFFDKTIDHKFRCGEYK